MHFGMFRTAFYKNTSGGLLLYQYSCAVILPYSQFYVKWMRIFNCSYLKSDHKVTTFSNMQWNPHWKCIVVRKLDLFNVGGQGETKLPSLTQVHKFEVINFYDLLRVSLNMVAEENQRWQTCMFFCKFSWCYNFSWEDLTLVNFNLNQKAGISVFVSK